MNKAKLLRIYTKIYAKTHRIKKTILFSSYGGAQYSDSPRVICEKMHEMYPEYELVWVFESPDEKKVPEYIKKVAKRSLDYYKVMATCCAYVTNEDLKEGQFKRTGQFFVQTWHGDRPFKKVLYQLGNLLPFVVTDNEYTDLCVAGSDYGEKLYRDAFRFSGEVIKVGTPRNDILVNSNNFDVVGLKKKMGIDVDAFVMLYAPTFRDNITGKQEAGIDIIKLINNLNCYNKKWVCIIRSHPGTLGILTGKNDSIIDVSNYDEIAHLYLIANCLVTDYSTCATDYILLKRPTILYVEDMEEYKLRCRDLLEDFLNTGFIFAKNQIELEKLLMNFEMIDCGKEFDEVNRYFGINETGNSAEKVCDRINAKCKEV